MYYLKYINKKYNFLVDLIMLIFVLIFYEKLQVYPNSIKNPKQPNPQSPTESLQTLHKPKSASNYIKIEFY